MSPTLKTLLPALLLPTVSAVSHWHINNFTATDTPTDHHIAFNISEVDFRDGVDPKDRNIPEHCTITWSSSPPHCWKQCHPNGAFYFRAADYYSASDFNLEIREYTASNDAVNYGTLYLQEGNASTEYDRYNRYNKEYECVRDGQSYLGCGGHVDCGFGNEESSVEFDLYTPYPKETAGEIGPICGPNVSD